jgi:hypothetical protein
MADDFDAPALMLALDQTEAAGVPPHLVEQLRELVREKEIRVRVSARADQLIRSVSRNQLLIASGQVIDDARYGFRPIAIQNQGPDTIP